MDEVEKAALELGLAVERMHHALDIVDNDRLACQYVPFKVPIALEHLALRLSTGQNY